MSVLSDYKKYEQYKPEYKQWKNNLEQNEVKRAQYIKQHNLKLSREDSARAKALLNAIDVMDEYSQTKSEEMEEAAEAAKQTVTGLASEAGIFAGMGCLLIPSVSKWAGEFAKKHPKYGMAVYLIPSLIGMAAGAAASIPMISWAASKQVGASRRGRFEAMAKDLENPAVFAVLTPEQEKQVKEIAKTVPVTKKMKKTVKQRMGKGFEIGGVFSQFKTLFGDDIQYRLQKKEFDTKLKKNEKRFNEPVSAADIERAKKDQQLLARIVEKMDYASQEYAEKVELAGNTFNALALAGGGLTGWLSSKLVKLLKSDSLAVTKGVPILTGFLTAVTLSMMSLKLQKQASRVGRYKAKQEMLNNQDNFIYVDENKLSKENVKVPRKQQENYFQFLGRIWRENREYNNHIKKDGMKQLKYQKAVEKIQLSDKQLKEAETLQMNTFKTFNRVDEKSQQYAESVEAAGEMIKLPVEKLGAIAASVIGLFAARKELGSIMKNTGNTKQLIDDMLKTTGKTLLCTAPVLAAVIGIDALFTKKQIEASRIADMRALKELSDYRHYINYDNAAPAEKTAAASSVKPEPKKRGNLIDIYSK